MPSLSGPQIRDLQEAMLDTFNLEELDQFVSIELEENLAAITGRGSLKHTIFELIQWCERRGRLADLLSAVLAYGPNNSTFLSLADEFVVNSPEENSDVLRPNNMVNDDAGQNPPVWWDQLAERIEEIAMATRSGGDTINVNIGDNAKNVAIGKNLQQTITEVIGEPTPDDKMVIEESLVALVEQLSTAQQQQATFQLQMLETELTKTGENEQPSGSAITLAGDWLLDNLPDIGEALASFFALPAVGRVLGKAGKDTINWAAERFGDASE